MIAYLTLSVHAQPNADRIGFDRAPLDQLIVAFGRADADWYAKLARNGYDQRPFSLDQKTNWAFYPLWPAIRTTGDRASGVTWISGSVLASARSDLVVLGANALFNPHILLRSNLHHPQLGRRLHEQVGVRVTVNLDRVDNFQGSTSMTGLGYMLYDGAHRAQYAAGLLETYNIPYLRMERGKWRRWMILKMVFEDLPDERNYVKLHDADHTQPETVYVGHSAYTQRAIDRLPAALEALLKPLPVERIWISPEVEATEYHIQGTTLMGDDPDQSIVDKHLIHHRIRNLVVLGSSVFPTGAPANPTLTLSALSLWSAAHLFG